LQRELLIDAYQRRPDDKVIEPDEKDLKGKGHVLLTTRFGPLDVLAVIEEGRGFEELFTDTVETVCKSLMRKRLVQVEEKIAQFRS